jgi:hypothetical protein
MKRIRTYIIVITIFLSACKEKHERPVWLNPSPSLSFHFQELKFSAGKKKWKALLINSLQPIELESSYEDGILSVKPPLKGGTIEGSAEICLSLDDDNFFYPVRLQNDTASFKPIIFRSPKTVNPDSSLNQQLILYKIDEFRNIATGKNNELFIEDEVSLSPRAGTYNTADPLKSYYVQPGSCVKIPVKSAFNSSENVFQITAGPLKDKNDNLIADGTLVTFIYDADKLSKMETFTLKGFATAKIPAVRNYQIYAQIDRLISEKIILKQ